MPRITIYLPRELEAGARAKSARIRMTFSSYVRQCIEDDLGRIAEKNKPITRGDMVSFLERVRPLALAIFSLESLAVRSLDPAKSQELILSVLAQARDKCNEIFGRDESW